MPVPEGPFFLAGNADTAESGRIVVPLRPLLEFRVFSARNFLERIFQKRALFLAGPAPNRRSVQQSDEHGHAGESKANQPENDKAKVIQPFPQNRFAGDKHAQRREEEKRAQPPAAPVSSAAHDRSLTPPNFGAETFSGRHLFCGRRGIG
jgi:hypothetical protein